MCTSPGILATGEQVGCRKCWQCKELRINDWVGRNIAESKTAEACHFVTLTYGTDLTIGTVDHERAAVLTYSDVQKFFKRLRKAGHKFRYFAIGEYGSLKGRSHWHVLMYWKNQHPKFTLNVREPSPFWDHGFVRWESIQNAPGAVRYACKYIQKDIDSPERQGHIAMSKLPPLGTEYFRGLAQKYVDAQLSPQFLRYGWPDVMDKNGKKIPFMMRGVVAENFVKAFLEKWERAHGKQHAPYSQAVEDILDKITRRDGLIDREVWKQRKAKSVWPWVPPPGGAKILISEEHEAYYVVHEGQKLFWSYDDEGERAWTQLIASESDAEKKRENVRKMLLDSTARQRQYRESRGG